MKTSTNLVVIALLSCAVTLEVLSIAEMASYPFFPDNLTFARLDAYVSDRLAPFSASFLILLLYLWIVRLGLSLNNRFSKRLKLFVTRLAQQPRRWEPQLSVDLSRRLTVASRPRLLLIIAIIASALLGLVPYRPDLNPSMTPVGVDAHFYIDSVNQMLQRSPGAAISYAMGNSWAGSRPLMIIPMYLAAVTGLVSANQTVESLPAILGPLLVLSIFFFVRAGKDEKLAGVASLFTAFSFSTTVGLWAGFYSNWLALAEAYLFLGILLGFLRTESFTKLVLMTILSVGIILTHPWTWVVVLGISTAFIVSVWKDDRKRIFLTGIIAVVIFSLGADLIKSLLFGGPVAAQDASGSLSQSGFFFPQNVWPNMLNGLFNTYNGLLGNALLVGLPVISILFIGLKDRFDRLLFMWVALSSLPFLFVGSLLQTRILYDLPLSVLGAIALLIVTKWLGNSTARANLIFLLVLLLSVSYALRAVTSLVVVPF